MLLPKIKSNRILMSPEELKKTEKIFKVFMKYGYSIRKLGKLYNIPWTTLRDRFKRLYGKDYLNRSGGEGTLHNIVQEYLEWNNLTDEQRQEILDWYQNQQDNLLEQSYFDQKNKKAKLYTEGKLDRDLFYQISLREDISSKVIKDERFSPTIS